jgi:hypothetical protein
MSASSAAARRRTFPTLLLIVLLLSAGVPRPSAAWAVEPGAATPVRAPAILTEDELVAWWNERAPKTDICNRWVAGACEERVPYEFRASAGSITPRLLIRHYIAEGAREGVAGDLALMQAILETAWFFFPDSGQVRPSDNNFAGMGAFDDKTHRPFQFPDARTGVRAQMQHLRLYADGRTALDGSNLGSPLAQDLDGRYPPRWRVVRQMTDPSGAFMFAGRAPMWDDFGGGMWASDPAYSQKVLNLYATALEFNGRRPDSATQFRRGIDPRLWSAPVVSRPLVGDWNGDGRVTPGWRIGDRFYLLGARAGGGDVVVAFGRASDEPFVGDWNGDGRTTIGVRRGSRWLLRNSNTTGSADLDFVFGQDPSAVGVVGDWNGDGRTTVGAFHPGGRWILRNSNSAGWADVGFVFGRDPGAQPVVGDWNGNGRDTVGVWYPGGRWVLRNSNSAGWADVGFVFGRASDARPVVGDWNRNGRDTIGVVADGNRWIVRNQLSAGWADAGWNYGAGPSTALLADWSGNGRATPGWKIGEYFHLQQARPNGGTLSPRYGVQPNDVPLAGDWNGNGQDTIGVRRGDLWLLRNSNDTGGSHLSFRYGQASDVAVVGDWNGNGQDTVGVRRGSRWLLRNTNSAGGADHSFDYGLQPGDIGVVGDWNGDGRTTVGVRRGGDWHLRNANTAGYADISVSFGPRATDEPFVGDWNGDGRTTVGIRRENSWLLTDRLDGGSANHVYRFG